jgi:hypothetical protein
VHSDPGAASYLTVPEAPLGPEPGAAARSCVAKRTISYRVRKPRNARIVSVAVLRGKRRLVLRRGHSVRSVTLRSPPRGRYRVKLVARDSRGRTRVAHHRISNC